MSSSVYAYSLAGLLAVLLAAVLIEYLSLKGRVAELERQAFEEARKEFQMWKSAELRGAYLQLKEEAEREAEIELKRWKEEEESRIREDAAQRSASVKLGRSLEQLIPVKLASEMGLDLEDFRFLGSPVDYLVFGGLSAGKPSEILFVEVKSSPKAPLSDREKLVKHLVDEKRVRFLLYYGESSATYAMKARGSGAIGASSNEQALSLGADIGAF
jgi:predicted Holliday junction resolvase-like endonuclease